MNKLLDNLNQLIVGTKVTQFEDQMMLQSTFTIGVILIFATMSNILLGLSIALILSTLVGTIIFTGLYLFGRIFSWGHRYLWISSFLILFCVDLLWLTNYGMHGSTSTVIVVFFAFLILVFDRRNIFTISVLLVLNIFCLYFLQYRFGNVIGDYLNDEVQFFDSLIGLIMSLVAIFIFTFSIKNNHIHQYERAKMADQLKSSFLANMSHEIRTPLNAIVGFSSLLAELENDDSAKYQYNEQILKNSDYLLSLIDDIIDVSKIESNQLSVKIQKVDIVPLINHLIESFQINNEHNHDLVIKSNIKDVKIVLEIDRVRLEQILRNLLSNAVKFTEKGKITVDCIREQNRYTFSVKDTGIGMNPEDQKIIFERFRKLENSRQQLYRGTGIGLFLSKQLVELFGGKIWVESEVGKGTTFYFTVPA
jgi:signal transduction histidine kinase